MFESRMGRAVAGLLLVSTLGVAACAALPKTFPRESPASPKAVEAPAARVTGSLSMDPPLPGEPAEGWSALDEEHDDHAR